MQVEVPTMGANDAASKARIPENKLDPHMERISDEVGAKHEQDVNRSKMQLLIDQRVGGIIKTYSWRLRILRQIITKLQGLAHQSTLSCARSSMRSFEQCFFCPASQ